jgi:hypothetical protein
MFLCALNCVTRAHGHEAAGVVGLGYEHSCTTQLGEDPCIGIMCAQDVILSKLSASLARIWHIC